MTKRSGKRQNPFFDRDRTRSSPLRFVLISLCLIALAAGTVFLLSSRQFAYDRVEINGTSTIAAADVQKVVDDYLAEKRAYVFRPSNRWLFREDDLSKRLSDHYAFEGIKIEKDGHLIRVSLQEKTSAIIWQTKGRLYLADRDGNVIRELAEPGEGEQPLPRFVDLNDVPVEVGDAILRPDEGPKIFQFHELVRGLQIDFLETQIDRVAGKLMKLKTTVGYDIIFDASGDIDAEARNLATVLSSQIKDPTRLKYIDVRFGDHVYYK